MHCQTATRTLLHIGACALLAYAPTALADLANTNPNGALGLNQASVQSGYAVANVGDLNGDGFQDMAVGVYGYANGQVNEGGVLIYFGSANGVDATVDATLEVDQSEARFGAAIAGVGDVNGDGYDDLLVGAPLFDAGGTNDGRAFLYFGGAGAFDLVADASLGLAQSSAFFGVSVAGAGDVNGDGYADLLVGSSGFDGAATNTGAALLYFGGAGAFNTTIDANLQSANGGVRFGSALAGVGDVNGDGFADIVIGSPFYANGQANEGAAFLYFGGGGAFNNAVDAHFEVNQIDAQFGSAVSAAGDINGDGFSDVVIGALLYDGGQADEGGAFVYHGAAVVDNVVDATLESNQIGGSLGGALSALGDINGDGYADIAVGAPLYDGSNADSGRAYVHLGAASGLQTTAYRQFDLGVAQPSHLGFALSGGDFDGNGFGDLIVGAPDFSGALALQGRALVYFGGTVLDDGIADGRVGSAQASGQLGHSVATGDLNGDGYADLASGAYGYDGSGGTNSGRVSIYLGGAAGFNTTVDAQIDGSSAGMRLGGSVAIGDINGDGYGDLIVGAPEYANGQALEGAVLIYFGAAGAFNTTADAVIESNQAGANLGFSVGYAGDINGDGYGDVLAGAPNFDGTLPDEGQLSVYFGGSTFNTTIDAQMVGAQGSTYLGWSVAGVGDINGDGFADIAAGGIGFDDTGSSNAGVFRLFLGSANFDTVADAQIAGGQTDARLGSALAGAGDVNGDGYSDLIVGAYDHDAGQVDEGRAYIYRGGAGAFSTTPLAVLESNQINAGFGSAVAGAGDVNGDGYADVLVGAPEYDTVAANDEGAAFLYLGGAGAFATTEAVRMVVSQGATRHGFAVALSDLNGDGFADPVVGAPSFDGSVGDDGAASVYLSNSLGKPVLAQQLSGTLGAPPVESWGLSQNANGLTAAASLFSPQGRERVKLEVEVCSAGTAFGAPGPSCTRSTSTTWTDTSATANGATLAHIAGNLTANRLYHWRARALYAGFSVTQPGITPAPSPRHGPWRRVRANAEVADIRVTELVFRNGFE